jgi:hypothetical protein
MALFFLKQNGVFHAWGQLGPSDLSVLEPTFPSSGYYATITISRAVMRVEQQKR